MIGASHASFHRGSTPRSAPVLAIRCNGFAYRSSKPVGEGSIPSVAAILKHIEPKGVRRVVMLSGADSEMVRILQCVSIWFCRVA